MDDRHVVRVLNLVVEFAVTEFVTNSENLILGTIDVGKVVFEYSLKRCDTLRVHACTRVLRQAELPVRTAEAPLHGAAICCKAASSPKSVRRRFQSGLMVITLLLRELLQALRSKSSG